jgi:hypothetical protein
VRLLEEMMEKGEARERKRSPEGMRFRQTEELKIQ